MKRGWAWGRLALLAVGALAGMVVWHWGSSLGADNTEARRILVTTFSILVGFLIATITMSGDPKGLYPGSWKVASLHRKEISQALRRYQLLFYTYLSVILLVLLGALCVRVPALATVVMYLERAALSLGVAALVWSFGLPSRLFRVQMERLADEVDARKKGDGDPRD